MRTPRNGPWVGVWVDEFISMSCLKIDPLAPKQADGLARKICCLHAGVRQAQPSDASSRAPGKTCNHEGLQANAKGQQQNITALLIGR
jgi:hypothetical protein